MKARRTSMPQTSRLFFKYFFSYAVVLIIPFVMGSFLYGSSVQTIERSAKQGACAILEQTRDILDTRIAELDSTAKQLTLSPQALSFLTMEHLPEGSPLYYRVWSFWQTLPNYALANSFIHSFFIVPRDAGVVVSAEELIHDDPGQFGRLFTYRDWGYQDWKDYLLSEPRNREFLSGVTLGSPSGGGVKGLLYVQTLPLESVHRPRGAFLVFIRESTINALLHRLDIGAGGLVLVSSPAGDLVAGLAGADCPISIEDAARREAADGLDRAIPGDYIVSRARSELTGWSFVSALPSALVLAEAHRVRNTALWVLGLSLALGLVVALLLARSTSAPIRAMAERMARIFSPAPQASCRDELEYLDVAFESLVAKDAKLREELAKQKPVRRAEVTRRLLHGLYDNEAEASEIGYSVGLVSSGTCRYAVAVVRISGYGRTVNKDILRELSLIRVAITDGLCDHFGDRIFTTEEEESLLGVLFRFAGEGEALIGSVEGAMASLAESLSCSYRVKLLWGLGKDIVDIAAIPEAYARARRELSLLEDGKAHLVPVGDEGEGPFYFPIELELRLVATIKGGTSAALLAVVEESARENLKHRRISDGMFTRLVEAIQVALVRGLASATAEAAPSGAVDEMAAALGELDRQDRVAWFSSAAALLESLRAHLVCARDSERAELTKAIADRLSALYPDQNLTMYAVAKEFDFSESAFYHFFRESFGRSYSDYLEDLRIREACRRMTVAAGERQDRVTIKDVASSVGFASDTTFRRAFHRVVGTSPSEYLAATGRRPSLSRGLESGSAGNS